jgi:hypothetical protein
VPADHLGDARAKERRRDHDHAAGHDVFCLCQGDPQDHAPHGVADAVHHRRLAAVQPGQLPSQPLEVAPEPVDLHVERQPRARAAEVVDLEPGVGESARHAPETEAAAHDALERYHGVGSRAPSGVATGANRLAGAAVSDADRPVLILISIGIWRAAGGYLRPAIRHPLVRLGLLFGTLRTTGETAVLRGYSASGRWRPELQRRAQSPRRGVEAR